MQTRRFDFSKRRASEPPTQNELAFTDWLPTVTPTYTWDWPYQRHIQAHLDRITDPKSPIRKLALFLPPRHGKSELVTVRYAAWRLERNPETRIVVAAYGQTLAEKFSRKARRIVQGRIGLSDTRKAADDWETMAGGGLRAVGLGGGITGQGFDLLIIDDPVKSREEAESEAYRERAWNWYTDDLYSRMEPGAAIILIQTRWHEDDLAGRILASEDRPNWIVVNLPAEAEENDPLGRAIGDPLCPDRFDRAALADIRMTMGRSYYALYQQRPMPPEGGMFKRSWFTIVDAAPAIAQRVRYWDKAATEGDGDFTAGVRMAKAPDGLFYVEDIVRGQWSAGEREKIIRQTAELDGVEVAQWLEQEPGSGGKESAQASVRNLAGYTARFEPVTGDKAVRAEPYAAQAEAGNVRLVRGAWIPGYLNELCTFPDGKNDDQVDGSSGAFNKLAGKRVGRGA